MWPRRFGFGLLALLAVAARADASMMQVKYVDATCDLVVRYDVAVDVVGLAQPSAAAAILPVDNVLPCVPTGASIAVDVVPGPHRFWLRGCGADGTCTRWDPIATGTQIDQTVPGVPPTTSTTLAPTTTTTSTIPTTTTTSTATTTSRSSTTATSVTTTVTTTSRTVTTVPTTIAPPTIKSVVPAAPPIPIARVVAPQGGGNHSLGVIVDGDRPPVGTADSFRQYDTFHGTTSPQTPEDWIGLDYGYARTFTSVTFQEGKHFPDGGWFTTLTVQVHRGGTWVPVTGLKVAPTYPGVDNGVWFETYVLTFTPITGDAIRVYGAPGGTDFFISCAELSVTP